MSAINDVQIEDEMKKSYLDYAMSVIISRALPDSRDGLKPVQRRVLYAMQENGYRSDKPHFKSARIAGDVMGKYHPHGDAAIYEAMVRMGRVWSMGSCLIDGQGNFGSIDGDPPAAMRYTEARLSKLSDYMVGDLDKNTVDWTPNYDETTNEPSVLPAAFPNLLVNGGSGIAVGMATNMPTHNLGEVIDCVCAYIDSPKITLSEMMEFIKGPDFPTGGIITNSNILPEVYTTGRGSITLRGTAHIETLPGSRKKGIIITEIPYQLNKKTLIEKIADLARDKKIDGISDVRDETDRDGIRIVVEIRAGITPEDVLEKLYTQTPLQGSFGVNNLALLDGRPETLSLMDMIRSFVTFREEVVTRRITHDLENAKKRGHVLIGLLVAVGNLDKVIELIRSSSSPAEAREKLMSITWKTSDIDEYLKLIDDSVGNNKHYMLSEEQARAILDLRLHRLTGLERTDLENEVKTLSSNIQSFLDILGSPRKLKTLIKKELLQIKTLFAKPRKTVISNL